YEDINSNLVPNLGYASTRNIRGGGALFENLEISNTPIILQGFPTVDLKPLLNEGRVKLKVKEVIPESVLNAAGIYWADYNSGEQAKFTAPITSTPGIKIAQKDKFDNKDLLNKLVNPFLDKDIDRDLAYLNSLFWVSFGQRNPEITTSDPIILDNLHWYRLYFSRPHNRSLIQYHSEEISAIYANVFANPGVSATINFNKGWLDDLQTFNQTLAMALGGIFEAVSVKKIDNRLIKAREKFDKNENFAAVKTKATPLQRQRINQRLEKNLFYTNLNSGLKQVSGTVTFPSKIRPDKSRIFQIRTGLHERGVYFVKQDLEEVIPGETFFSLLRLSNKDFGPLTFIGNPIDFKPVPNIPKQQKKDKKNKQEKAKKSPKLKNENSKKANTETILEQQQPIDRSSAVKTIINTENGEQFIKEINSADNLAAPIGIRTYDLAFDRIEFTRIDRQNINFDRYVGHLNLPAVEGAFSGSRGNFNYNIHTGIWFNLDYNVAPTVHFNNFGIKEPTFGIYANSLISYQFLDIELDKEKKPKVIRTHTPVLKINWNSSSNSYNPFLAVATYSYYRQDKNLKLSLTPGLAFVEYNSNGELTGIFDGNINIKNNIEFNGNAEIGKEIFFSLEGLKTVSHNWAIGAYLQNYSINKLSVGLNSRVSNLNYGLLVRHNFKDNPIYLEGKIGTGEKGFDARFEGGYRF
ncbi:MAG: hypothetical protein ACFBSE_20995, partial [Prochloraceae cyanobacterium]